MTTTDLQKPFTDEQLREVMAPFPVKPLAGYANAEQDLHDAIRHQNLLSLIKEKRAAMAPTLAARVLELEAETDELTKAILNLSAQEKYYKAENKRLREAIADARLIAVDAQLRATYQKTAIERLSDLLRAALKEGEI